MPIEPAVPLNNPFQCWDVNYLLISTKISLRCDRYLQAFEFNSLCFNFVCLLCFNFVCCMVKFVGFNRTAALFLGFCFEGLLLRLFSCLFATVDVLLSTAILVFR